MGGRLRVAALVSALVVGVVVPVGPAAAVPGDIVLASTSSDGVKGDGYSYSGVLSGDGSVVVFESESANLDPADTDIELDIYAKDLSTGELTLVSTSDAGVTGAGHSFGAAVSEDGTRVAFHSYAALDPADTDVNVDIYVKDLTTGDVTLVSTSTTGVKGNATSLEPSISADGTRVAFISVANNLDPADTFVGLDVYVKDLTTGVLTLASTSDSGVNGNGTSQDVSLSGDGTRVAFRSEANNLDPGDTDTVRDLYVKDLVSGDVSLVSTSTAGVKGDGGSYFPELSYDGSVVAFHSQATNFDPLDTDNGFDVYVKDLDSGVLTLVSQSAAGVKGNGSSAGQALSADGTLVAFASSSWNLVPGDTTGVQAVFVKDLVTGDIVLASTSAEDVKADGFSVDPSLSSDGSLVAFHSAAANLVPGDTESDFDVYVKSLTADTTPPSVPESLAAMSVGHAEVALAWDASSDDVGVDHYVVYRDGVEIGTTTETSFTDDSVEPETAYEYTVSAVDAAGNPSAQSDPLEVTTDPAPEPPGAGSLFLASTSSTGVKGDSSSTTGPLSADGTVAVFDSVSSNLDPADTDGELDVYAKDVATGELTLVSTSDTGTKGNADSYEPAVSADGSLVVFQSTSVNLDPADTDGHVDVYVKNLVTGELTLVSTSSAGVKGNAGSSFASISADGTKVAFMSSATNFVAGDGDSGLDVYVKDLVTGTLTLASTSGIGVKGNGASEYPFLSGDGTLVLFSSMAMNLDGADTDSVRDSYVKDLVSGELTLVSVTSGGVKGDGGSRGRSISEDGTRVAFESTASNLDPGDVDTSFDAYVKDLVTGELILVSRPAAGAKLNVPSVAPTLSADGTRVAFASGAWNLHPDDVDSVNDLFVKNVATGAIELVSTSTAGEKGDGASHSPYLSADGTRVAFHSAATNLDPVDDDTDFDVYVKTLGDTADTTPPSAPENLAATSVGHDEVALSWDASTDDVGVDHYVVYRDGVEIGTTTETSFTDGTVAPETDYEYTVSAVDAAGNPSAQSDPLDVTTDPAPDTTAPSVPTDLATTSVTHSLVTLGWTASTDDVGVDHYVVYRDGVEIGTTTETSFTDGTVGPDSGYEYTVSAEDAAGNASAQSDPLAVTTDPVPEPPPAGALVIGSITAGGTKGNGNSYYPSLSADGSRVAFHSQATNLAGVDTDSLADAYLKDVVTGSLTLVSVSGAGVKGNGASEFPSVSGDGTQVAFETTSTNLDAVDTDFFRDVYVKNVVTGDLTLVSVTQTGTKGSASSSQAVMSADGTRVAFESGANLDPADSSFLDVYVKDLVTGEVFLASATEGGVSGNGSSFGASLSADGTVVAFYSAATNLHPDDTDSGYDVYVKDLATGELTLASRSESGAKGNGQSQGTSLSADGALLAFISTATNLHPADTDATFDVYVKDLVTGEVTLVSRTGAGVKGNGNSFVATISATGDRVTFMSLATNLSPADTVPIGDVYVKDLTSGRLVLASVSTTGVKGNFANQDPTMSSDGDWVAFWGGATNLHPADTDSVGDVFVKHVVLEPDVDAPSVPQGLAASSVTDDEAALEWDASTDDVGVDHYVVYRDGVEVGTSTSTSFTDSTVAADTSYEYTVSAVDASGNESAQSHPLAVTTEPVPDVTPPSVPADLAATSVTHELVSLGWTASSDDVAVDHYVVYRDGVSVGTTAATSYVDATVEPETGYEYTVTAVDAAGNESGQSDPLEVTTEAAPDTTPPSAPADLTATAVTYDFVALSWSASTDDVAVDHYVVYRDGVEVGTPATTGFIDGSVAAETAYGYTVSAVDAAGNESDPTDVLDVTTGAAPLTSLYLASITAAGVKGDAVSQRPSVSADGSLVAFYSDASNLDPADTDTVADVFVKDLVTGQLTLVSTSDAGVKGNGYSFEPSLSGDGSRVAFTSEASNLDPADTDADLDVFVKDLVSGEVTLVSTSDDGVKSNSPSYLPSLSGDGSRVAFSSNATNLDPADTDTTLDVFVKDLVSGELTLVSTSDDGVKGDGSSLEPSLSADGSRVAFYSFASNLDPADTDTDADVFVKDLVSGDLTLVSVSDDGVKGDGYSFEPSLSGDGSRVAFTSDASNLDPADTDTTQDVFVNDLVSGDLTLVSTSDDGVKGNNYSFASSLSGDGSRVAFYSHASNLDPADTDTDADVFVKDLVSGDLMLVSTSDAGVKGNSHSFGPSLSGDGTRVAFSSNASNLDPADTDNIQDVFVKDLAADGVPPSVPAGLTATSVAHDEVVLGWDAATDDDSGVDHYVVYRDGVELGTTGTTSYTDSTVAPDTTYEYTVAAVDFAGNESAQSDPLQVSTDPAPDVTAPSVPTDLATASVTHELVSLGWTASTDDAGVDHYVVYRDGVELATTAATTYIDTTVAPETTYEYTVSAVDAAGNESDPSEPLEVTTDPAPDTTPPSVPVNVSATAVAHEQVVLAWDSSTDDDSGVEHYVVYRDGVELGTTTTTVFSDNGVAPETTYEYTVTAVDAAGNESAPSDPLEVTTDPAPDTTEPSTPADLTTTSVTHGLVSLGWGASTDDVGVDHYVVYRDGVEVGATTATSFVDVTVAPSTSYGYTVTAVDATGNASAPTDVLDVTTDPPPPPFPRALYLASTSGSDEKGIGSSAQPSLSADGRSVAFWSFAPNLHPDDPDGYGDVFVKDVVTGEVTLVSVTGDGVKGDALSEDPSISADGTRVAFVSTAATLHPDDSTSWDPDVYVKDLGTGELFLVSTSDAEVKANGASVAPSISADGTRVAFFSVATNLDPDDASADYDVYVKDLVTGELTLVSVTEDGVKGNSTSVAPRMFPDGTKVAFESLATNFDPTDTDAHADVYVKDLVTGALTLASTTDTGGKPNGSSTMPSVSWDGTRLAFISTATNLDPADSGSTFDVYVKDLVSGEVVLASVAEGGAKGNAASGMPVISLDGTMVAFATSATNLDPSDTDGVTSDVYAKDLVTGELILISTSSHEGKGNSVSTNPSISADGAWIAFETLASNLDPADTDGETDIYVKDLAGDGADPSIPQGLEAVSVSHDQVVLQWEAATDAGSDVDHYVVYRDWVAVGTATGTSFTDDTVEPDTSYEYMVTAVDAFQNESDVSDPLAVTTDPSPDTTPPSVPGDLTATSVTHEEVVLGWDASSDEVGVDHYVVYRDGVEVGTTGTTSFTDSAVEPATGYEYTVSAVDAVGNESNRSAPLEVTTEPAPDTTPPTVAITAPAGGATVSGSVTVAVDASDDTGVVEVEVLVDGAVAASLTSAPYTYSWDTTTDEDGAHAITATASDAAGNTATSDQVSVTVDNTPEPVGQFTASPNPAAVGQTITFTDAHTGTHRRVVSYGDGTSKSGRGQTFTKAYSSPGTYTASIDTMDVATGARVTISIVVTVGTLTPDTTPPSAPSDLAVTGTSDTTVSLAWDASSDDVGVNHYVVARGGVDVGTTAGLTFVDTGRDAETTYSYEVFAVDSAGNRSGGSGPVEATTEAAPPDVTPPSVSILTPAPGAVVSGVVTVTVSASDNAAVGSVELLVDGEPVGTLAAAPFSFSWDTAVTGDGERTLTAVAVDTSGNDTTSAGVTVTVDSDAPVGQLTASPPTATVGQTVTFTDAHTGTHRRVVTFGDGTGTSGKARTFTQAYAAAGTYVVTMETLSVDTGIRGFVTTTIVITTAPTGMAMR